MKKQGADPGMQKGASLSECGKYRYALWRVWDENRGKVLFIGLNPSTADGSLDDTTIRRCMSYARQWGYGGILMGNLFAFRSTHPERLAGAVDPVGPENDAWLTRMAEQADLAVAMWGNGGCLWNRSTVVEEMIPDLYCLRVTGKGEPHHTRGLPDGIRPVPFPKRPEGS